jgi:hypothetical protein
MPRLSTGAVSYEQQSVTLIGGLSQELLNLVLNQPGGLQRYIEPLILASKDATITTVKLAPMQWPTNMDEELALLLSWFHGM